MTGINRNVGEKPELDWIDVERIDVDSNYQREIKGNLVERILKNFSWAKFGAVVLSRQEGGRFTIVEGQHRWKAATLHPDISRIPAVIVRHDDVAGEAESFIAINRDRMAVTSIEQFWAGLTAGDDMAIRISKVLKSANCDVVPASGHYRPNLTNAVSALDRCLKRYGDGSTKRALLIIRAAWPNDAKALRGTLITSIARIIHTNKADVQDPELVRAIAGESFAQLTAHAEGFRKLSGGSAETALARTITELYNRGKRSKAIYFGAAA